MTRTTISKLQRLREMREAAEKRETWWTNPNGHPDPDLPSQAYLEGEYLRQITASSPQLVEKVRDLVSFAGRERRG